MEDSSYDAAKGIFERTSHVDNEAHETIVAWLNLATQENAAKNFGNGRRLRPGKEQHLNGISSEFHDIWTKWLIGGGILLLGEFWGHQPRVASIEKPHQILGSVAVQIIQALSGGKRC